MFSLLHEKVLSLFTLRRLKINTKAVPRILLGDHSNLSRILTKIIQNKGVDVFILG